MQDASGYEVWWEKIHRPPMYNENVAGVVTRRQENPAPTQEGRVRFERLKGSQEDLLPYSLPAPLPARLLRSGS